MAGTPRPKRVAVSGVVACRSEEGCRRSCCSRRRYQRASVGFYVPMMPPDGRLGIPKNHLNLARIRFHTSSPARSPERPSLRRHLNVKRNKSSTGLHLLFHMLSRMRAPCSSINLKFGIPWKCFIPFKITPYEQRRGRIARTLSTKCLIIAMETSCTLTNKFSKLKPTDMSKLERWNIIRRAIRLQHYRLRNHFGKIVRSTPTICSPRI